MHAPIDLIPHKSAFLAAFFLVPISASAATVLTNEGFASNNQALPGGASYASNIGSAGTNWSVSTGVAGVSGTPDIALAWSGIGGNSGIGFDTFASFTTHGKVIQLDGTGGGAQPQFQIVFTPAQGAVLLTSFDLISGNTAAKSVAWSVTGVTSGTLASGTWSGNTDARDTIGVNATGLAGEALTLTLTGTTGPSTFLGFDNLSFDQVPEPGAWGLATALGFTLALRRRRG